MIRQNRTGYREGKVENIDIFVDRVEKKLHNLAPHDAFLSDLRSDLTDFVSDDPDCTIDDMIEQFGRPEDIARDYLDSTGCNAPREIARKNKRRNIAIIALVAVLIAFGVYHYIDSQPREAMTVDVEVIHEDPSEGR